MRPFIKWAGGKRWLLDSAQLEIPAFHGRYIEPFLGGGAVFFHLSPERAILSDVNSRLIETYKAVRSDWRGVERELKRMQALHSKEFYYSERGRQRRKAHTCAAQFLYLNRTCWNGLYRENLAGKFNVPIGSKSQVILADDDFESASAILQNADLRTCDFEDTLQEATQGDLVFLDPPYTTAHNTNGFVKYNQKIFSWEDQKRLRRAAEAAANRGAKVVLTNADHKTIRDLYASIGEPEVLSRSSVISGSSSARGLTTEVLYIF
ncbi:DNA adenine methylase [Martelella sp. FOR1707]